MKILHTADWHLDVSPRNAPRHEEHRLFLDWFVEYLEGERIEVLLHAGDIFDRAQPSSRAINMFNAFMARIARLDHMRHVVLISGNHDPDSFINAQRPVFEELEGLDVRVVTSAPLRVNDEDWSEHCLVPLEDADGEISCVVAAIPYVNRAKLGVYDASAARRNAMLREGVTRRYRELADIARKRYGDEVELIAMGHLTCYSGEGDPHQPRRIHLGETLGPEVFDARYSYVALGHIHDVKLYEEGRVCYPGPPVPTNRVEALTAPRKMARLELRDGVFDGPTLVDVPQWRRSIHLRGRLPAVITSLLERVAPGEAPAPSTHSNAPLDEDRPSHLVPEHEELAPYLYLDLDPGDDGAITHGRILTLLEEHELPVHLVSWNLIEPEGEGGAGGEATSYDDLDPETLLAEMYRARHGEELPEALLLTFREVLDDLPS